MSDTKMREEFEKWHMERYGGFGLGRSTEPGYTDEYERVGTNLQWVAWQAARTVPALHAEQIRVAAVAAIREVTGCPDIKGNDGAYLVDALIVNLLSAAPEGKK